MNKTLQDLAVVHYGKSPSDVRVQESNIPVYGTGGVYGAASKPMFDGPLVVVARKGTLGNPSYAPNPCWVVDTAYAVIPRKGVDAKWLFYQFANFNLETLNEATGVPSISRDYLYRVSFPDTPHREQRKIARILTTLDNLIEKTEALIAKYQAIKQGMMHDLFTRGINSNGQLRPTQRNAPDLYKQSDLGWIPKEWDEFPLTKVASYQSGNAFPSTDYCDEGIPLLRPGNMPVHEFVEFDDGHTTCLPWHWESQAREYLVAGGELVMNLTAQSLEDQFLGRVCMTRPGTHCLLNQRIARFRTKACDLRFLFWWFKGPQFRREIDRITQGTKVQHIYNSNLNSMNVAVPKTENEQRRIAEILFSVAQRKLGEESRLAKLADQKKGLMQDLLTGKVRVNVDEAKREAAHA